MFRVYKIVKLYKQIVSLDSELLKTQLEYEERKLSPIRTQLIKTCFLFLLFLFIYSGIILLIDEITTNAFSLKKMNFFDAFYFSIITSTTIGYGEIIPTNTYSRYLIVLIIFVSLIFVSNQISEIMSVLEVWGKIKYYYSGVDHILVFYWGVNPLTFNKFIKIIRSKYVSEEIVVVHEKYSDLANNSFNDDVILVKNKNFDHDLFHKVNATKACAIFIMVEKTKANWEQKEKFNERIIHSVGKLFSHIPIYVETLFTHHDKDFLSNFALYLDQNQQEVVEQTYNIYLKQHTKNISLNYEFMIPVYKLKQMIFAKSVINPGFPTFIQNLLQNDLSNYHETNIYSSNTPYGFYLQSVTTTIKFIEAEKSFHGRLFRILMKQIYRHSKNKESQLLLIGIYTSQYYDTGKKDNRNGNKVGKRILLVPMNNKIQDGDELVFLTNLNEFKIRSLLNVYNLKMSSFKRLSKIAINSKKNESDFKFPKTSDNNFPEIEHKNILVPNQESDNTDKFDWYVSNTIDQHYSNNFKQQSTDHCEERIYSINSLNKNCDSKKIKKFSQHIIIIGYIENIKLLVNMISYHLPQTDILVVTNNQDCLKKMKSYMYLSPNLYLIQTDPSIVNNLEKIGISKVLKCYILTEDVCQMLKDDSDKILCFNSIKNAYNTECLIELSTATSLRIMGFSPMEKINPYEHPLFVSGNVFYSSHLDKLISNAYIKKKKIEAILKMVTCGYDYLDYINYNLPLPNELECPIIFTIPVPSSYHGKSYYDLASDLTNSGLIPLGLYIENPVYYLEKDFEGINDLLIGKNEFKENRNEDEDIVAIKRYFSCIGKMEKFIQKPIQSQSHVDIRKSHLPLFITNPSSELMIERKTKVQILKMNNFRLNN